MKWIKFSEQKPEPGTLCLCKRTEPICGYSDFDVAQYMRYEYAEKGVWLIFGAYRGCTQLPDNYYDYWMPLEEIDIEASQD